MILWDSRVCFKFYSLDRQCNQKTYLCISLKIKSFIKHILEQYHGVGIFAVALDVCMRTNDISFTLTFNSPWQNCSSLFLISEIESDLDGLQLV